MEELLQEFLTLEPEISDPEREKLAFLDRGYLSSIWSQEIHQFSARLGNVKINNYPDRGVIPSIDLNFLSFLHEDITEACLCVIEENNCHWFGRRPMEPVQLWSATKFLPIYHLLSQVNNKESPFFWQIRNDQGDLFDFKYLVDLVFTYDDLSISSNSLALMFKTFYAPETIEGWLHDITGNTAGIFRGGYGEPSFIQCPVLQQKEKELLRGSFRHQGQNLLSTYDLTRALTHLAWIECPHRYDILIAAMAKDTARYLDVALEKRSLCHLSDVVILSKMGFGRSSERDQTELVYTALLSARELSFCLTYKGAAKGADPSQEAKYLDARMATEVTKTILGLGW